MGAAGADDPRHAAVMTIRLHLFVHSPYAAKVRKCLELKGLAFEVVEVPYLDRRELTRLTGGIYVPAIEDGGTAMAESARITAYLDERYAPSLRKDPLAVVLEAWADNVLEDVAFRLASPGLYDRFAGLHGGRADAAELFKLLKERKFGPGCLDVWRASAGAFTARLQELLRPIEAAVADREYGFILGPAPSLADAAVWGELWMLEIAYPGFVEKSLAGLAAWYRRVGKAEGIAT
jgi:glutathione S-transferase